MFPVRLLLSRLDGTYCYSESEVLDLFTEDMTMLGGGRYRGSVSMPDIGTGIGFQFYFDVKTCLDLCLIVEYTKECHNGFSVIAMRDAFGSISPSPLFMSHVGDDLDDLPPATAMPLRSDQYTEDAAIQDAAVQDWQSAWDYIQQLEMKNAELRHRLSDYE